MEFIWETRKRNLRALFFPSLLYYYISSGKKKSPPYRHTKREQVIHRSVHKHTITRGGGFEIQAGDVAFIN